MICALCCHIALAFAVMHLYKNFLLLLFIPFFVYFFYLFKNMVLTNRRNCPRYQRVLAFCAFLTGAIPKGLILRKFCFDVCVCFVMCRFASGLILCFFKREFVVWWLVWRVNRKQIEVCFNPVILCGWLGSKYQLTNNLLLLLLQLLFLIWGDPVLLTGTIKSKN